MEDEVEPEDESEDDNETDQNDKPDIQELSALELFTETLRKAHDTVIQAEHDNKSHRGPYQRNSRTTKWRHNVARETLAQNSFLSIQAFIAYQKTQKHTECNGNALSPQVSSPSLSVSESPSINDCMDIDSESESEQIDELSTEGNAAPILAAAEQMPELLPLDPEQEEKLRQERIVKEMLADLQAGKPPSDNSEETDTDRVLNQLNYKNFAALQKAAAELKIQSKDPKLGIVFRARLTAMTATLNLYLDSKLSYTWRQASAVAARSQGNSPSHARTIREWLHQYISYHKLPFHKYRGKKSTILEDEIALSIQLQLVGKSKEKYIKALDVVEIVAGEEIQSKLVAAGKTKLTVSERTAHEWLKQFKWRYSRRKNGMYIDGHEKEEVVEYRKQFVQQWMHLYTPRMTTWEKKVNQDGTETLAAKPPKGGVPVPPGWPFRLILVTHDESTYYCNDSVRMLWQHADNHVPQPKGDGSSIMVLDFLTVEWGHLVSCDGKE